jgi:SAM-dependent methyltransferase
MNSRHAAVRFELSWESDLARHTEAQYAGHVNFWRDILPPGMEGLAQSVPGQRLEVAVPHGEYSIPPHDPSQVLWVKDRQFNRRFVRGMTLEPRLGRFYPCSMIEALPGHFKGDYRPARLVAVEGEGEQRRLQFDLNHPLARRPLRFAAELLEVLPGTPDERGGRCNDWVESCGERGPGLQARDRALRPDLLRDEPFSRLDENADGVFYSMARTLPHIDAAAGDAIAELHRRRLPEGGRILDLMSSWQSHLPVDREYGSVVGLGMNAEELAQNPRLNERLVHDLNRQPRLPFGDGEFDAAICNLSVEYLTQPFAVFAEVARVLKPGGLFVIPFSNRWFPPKVIQLWTQLHDFERPGLVLDYFLESGRFEGLETFSLRGLPRPEDDKYAAQTAQADPVYAVWGRKRLE